MAIPKRKTEGRKQTNKLKERLRGAALCYEAHLFFFFVPLFFSPFCRRTRACACVRRRVLRCADRTFLFFFFAFRFFFFSPSSPTPSSCQLASTTSSKLTLPHPQLLYFFVLSFSFAIHGDFNVGHNSNNQAEPLGNIAVVTPAHIYTSTVIGQL